MAKQCEIDTWRDEEGRQSLRESMRDLFACLDEREQEMLEGRITVVHFGKNETIYNEGEQPNMLFCLLRGKVKVFKQGVGGRNQTVRLVRPMEYFGYRPFLSGETFLSGAATLEASYVAEFPLPYLVNLIRKSGRVAWFFIQQLAVALGRADNLTVSLTQKHVRGRLAQTLLMLVDCYGMEADGRTLSAHLSRDELADLANMTRSNAARTLSSFAADGLIELDGRAIRLLDEGGLQLVSKMG